jgi:hypothetical protein
MTEKECLSRMIAPGTRRPGKFRDGVIQIWVTRACDKACFGCTQGSNLASMPGRITVPQFAEACKSLGGYFGVVGMFGGNPAMHPNFEELCDVMAQHIPFEQRGLWCNNPIKPERATKMRATFNPNVSNLNVHLDKQAFTMFKEFWPECMPFGLSQDSRHSPPYVAMKDVIADEGERWALIADCDINKHWSAMIGVFRGELRAWFCEIAGAQAMLHQNNPDYPDTGIPVNQDGVLIVYDRPGSAPGNVRKKWWELPMSAFTDQVRKHCHDCGVPLRGYGQLAQAERGVEQTSATHLSIYNPKKSRHVEIVTSREQLGKPLAKMTDYLGNAVR